MMNWKEQHFMDGHGNPAGGNSSGCGFNIKWQKGPLMVDGERKEPNGTFVETLLEVVKGRLVFYQGSKFACNENERAIASIDTALAYMHTRTANREARNVEGTHAI